METTFKKVSELIKDNEYCPLPLEVIPNQMGINLCSVEAISWKKQSDGQLVNLTIHFLPDYACKEDENNTKNENDYVEVGIQKITGVNFDITNDSFVENVTEEIIKELDNVMIEGLKRKGYVFENRNELIEFVEDFCRREDNEQLKQRIYYVKDIPFLLHNYGMEISYVIDKIDSVKITANCGTYSFL